MGVVRVIEGHDAQPIDVRRDVETRDRVRARKIARRRNEDAELPRRPHREIERPDELGHGALREIRQVQEIELDAIDALEVIRQRLQKLRAPFGLR